MTAAELPPRASCRVLRNYLGFPVVRASVGGPGAPVSSRRVACKPASGSGPLDGGSMLRGSMRVLSLVVLVLTGTAWSAAGQITSGTVSGTVTDSTGGVVPGASVMLVSEAQARRIGPAVTNAEGAYVFPNIIADTYTVEVSLTGFKSVSRTGIRVSGGARVAVAAIVLEAGGVTAQVDVKAEAPLVKAASGERSSAIEKTQ